MKRLIAEFEPQTFTQIIFPHKETDWSPYLQDAQRCFCNIINAIIEFQACLVVCADIEEVQSFFKPHPNLFFTKFVTDDTWARDCSALSVEENNKVVLYDFVFNAWGDKFGASQDNLLTKHLAHCYDAPLRSLDFVLEGGSIESNAKGLLLSTSKCIYNTNRNPQLNTQQRDQILKDSFGLKEILYLHHGYLAGDDTDAHIDTLARFINHDTICYVQCHDTEDIHYEELHKMEQELKQIAQKHQLKLLPLPMCSALFYEQERLPATYANFLFVNGGILLPLYGVKEDEEALSIFQKTFPERKVVGIDCSVLVRQHGSLHCVTMNFHAPLKLERCLDRE